MSSDMWTLSYYFKAMAAKDQPKIDLMQCVFDSLKLQDNDPEAALALYVKGREMAEALNEAWWMLYFDHWQLQMLIVQLGDYNRAFDLAVRATAEARKPEYAGCPQRICIHEDLISLYMGKDPIGYADLIEQALNYMDTEITDQTNCRNCLQGRKINFEMAHKRLDRAEAETMRYMEMTENSDHYRIHAYGDLCSVAFEREDWTALLKWAKTGQELAEKKDDRKRHIVQFMAWQALGFRQTGEELTAQQYYRMATTRSARLRVKLGGSYYDALAAYHEKSGRLKAALKIRDQQLAALAGKGQTYYEARCRVRRCRLLHNLGERFEADASAAREVIAQLVKQDTMLAELDALTA